jgi:hypothetical protein
MACITIQNERLDTEISWNMGIMIKKDYRSDAIVPFHAHMPSLFFGSVVQLDCTFCNGSFAEQDKSSTYPSPKYELQDKCA